MSESHAQRILAVDLHPRSFAFVVFEGPRKLIDWGARSFRHGPNAVLVREQRKFGYLIDHYAPQMTLLRCPRARRVRHMLEVIKREATSRHIPVRVLPLHALNRAFSEFDGNKYELAAAIAAKLPQLRTILPPRRKPWESERYPMSIFDAAAVGIAYFRPPSDVAPDAPNLSNGPQG